MSNKILKEYDEKSSYSHIKDIDLARPRMAPKPDTFGMAKSESARDFGLYLQDEASDIMVDKYGYPKGHDMWYGSITAGKNGNAMFAMSAEVANEKAIMIRDLSTNVKSYWERSYFDIWKEWVKTVKGKDISHLKPLGNKKVEKELAAKKIADDLATQKAQQAVIATKDKQDKESRFIKVYGSYTANNKDIMRVQDLLDKADWNDTKATKYAEVMADKTGDIKKMVGRWKAAEDQNEHKVADVFYKRALELFESN